MLGHKPKKFMASGDALAIRQWLNFPKILLVGFCLTLAACSGGTGSGSATTGSSGGTEAIAVWGDSTTAGVGASDGMSFPDQLHSITGRSVFNGGVSGQTSDQIAAREGGAPALLTFPNNRMPASGAVVLVAESTFPVTADGPGPITGNVNGIHGTLNYQTDGSGNPELVFTRETAGSVETIPAQTPFHPDTFGREAQINVFWMGQNNLFDTAQVKSDIAKSVAFLTTNKFVVMSILNASNEGIGTDPYNAIIQLNNELAQAYPNNYLDIRGYLVTQYDPSNPQDVMDYNNDIPPSSLHNDTEHLNDAGYRLVAQRVAAFIAEKGW